MRKVFSLLVTLSLLAGCGGSYSVTRTGQATPEYIRTVLMTPRDGNSPEVTEYVSDALAAQGVTVTGQLPAGVFKTDKADAVVSYLDVWRWDISTYLQSISISLYDAKTGNLVITGRWRDSFFHTWNRGEGVSKELIAKMLAELGALTVPAKEAAR